MKKIFIAAALTLVTDAITAQITTSSNILSSNSKAEEIRALSGRAARNVTTFDDRYEGVKGSPFLDEDWMPGKLTLSDSLVIDDKTLYKFDAYSNEIWIKLITNQARVLYNNDIIALEIDKLDGKILRFKKAKLPDSNDKHHFALARC